VVTQAHDKKTAHYSEIVKGYRQFLKGQQIASFDPPAGKWSHRDLTVTVNPELGLKLGGADHLVKLYFKSPAVSRRRVEVVLHLMEGSLAHSSNNQIGLLDARRGKLWSPKALSPDLHALLAGEAAGFLEMWGHI